MDLKIECKRMEIDGYDCGYKVISLSLENINKSDLNNEEVAKCVDIETYMPTITENELRSWVENNYDWFEEKD